MRRAGDQLQPAVKTLPDQSFVDNDVEKTADSEREILDFDKTWNGQTSRTLSIPDR